MTSKTIIDGGVPATCRQLSLHGLQRSVKGVCIALTMNLHMDRQSHDELGLHAG